MMRGYLYVFLAALLWGGIGPLARFAFADGATPLETAFWRAVTGALFFGIHGLVRREYSVAPSDRLPIAAFGLVGISLFFASYQIAVRESGAALASMLLYTAPAWVALLSRLFLKEALTPLKLAALGVSMGGAALVSLGGGLGPGSGFSLLGIVAGLVSGFTYALHYLFGKRYLPRYPAATLYLYLLPTGALGLLPWVEFTLRSWTTWAVFLFLGLCGTYGAFSLYARGLRQLSATRVAVTANLEPVIAALLAYLWWGELFSPLGYLGGLLVLGGVGLMVAEGARRAPEPAGQS